MGMFDDVKCSYNIGELTNVSCQTKDMDPFGGTMSFYWVDPTGALWTTDYLGTSSIEIVEGENLKPWEKLKYIPTGVHGRVTRVWITDYVEIYEYKTQADGVVDCVRCRLHFVDGILQEYKYINNHILS